MSLVGLIESGANLDDMILTLISKSCPTAKSSDTESPLSDDNEQLSTLAMGFSLLHVAASQGLTDVVRFLLDMGCDVNCTTLYHQRTVLHMALYSMKEPPLELIEMLLNAGADATRLEKRLAYTVAHVAVMDNYAQVLPLLVSAGCPLDEVCCEGFTALYHAVSNRSMDCIRVLVKAGANCDVNVNGNGGTALHHAVYHSKLVNLH